MKPERLPKFKELSNALTKRIERGETRGDLIVSRETRKLFDTCVWSNVDFKVVLKCINDTVGMITDCGGTEEELDAENDRFVFEQLIKKHAPPSVKDFAKESSSGVLSITI